MIGNNLSFCHGKLSEAVLEICTDSRDLRSRLHSAVLRYFCALTDDFFPEPLKEEYREIRSEVTRVHFYGHEADMVEHEQLSQLNAKRLINKLIVLRDHVAMEHYKRQSIDEQTGT